MEPTDTATKIRPEMVGIMADSHGRPETIVAAVEALRCYGCSAIYHLGDVCDSAFPETTDACVKIIRQEQILAVKGNNEHTVSVNYLDREEGDQGEVSTSTALYLGRLPLVRRLPGALFCHSLPFERELGLSAMVRVMDKGAALWFRDKYPGHVVFRGHNHRPEIIRFSGSETVAESLPAGRRLALAASRPCVVTCGALTDGLCLVWNSAGDWICSLVFSS